MTNAGRLAVAIDGGGATFPSLRDVAGWLEACAVRQWVPGRSFAPPTASALATAALAATAPAVRHVCHPSDRGGEVASGSGLVAGAESTDAVVASLVATARYALSIRATWIVVEPGPLPRDVADVGDARDSRATREARRSTASVALLDRACRTLHDAIRQVPAVGIALVTPATHDDFGRPEELAAIFEDLGPRRRVAYWHDAGRAHAVAASGGGPATEWLSRHGARCVGVDACDALGGLAGLPAGAGEIDFAELRSAVAASVPFVARVEPFVGPGPLLGAVRHLRGLGL